MLAQFIAGATIEDQISAVPSVDDRVDAEYYQPKYLRLVQRLAKLSTRSIDDLSLSIRSGPFGSNLLKTSYLDDGVVVLRPFNIKDATIESDNLVYISEEDCKAQGLYLYKEGDIAFARVGDIRCGVVPDYGKPVTISPNIIMAQVDSEMVNPYFLSVFMNTYPGMLQMERGLKVVAQPTITVDTIKAIQIPNVPLGEQGKIAELFKSSLTKASKSKELYAEAEGLLLAALGLDGLDLSPQLSYTAMFDEVATAERFDSEYYQPKYFHLREALQNAVKRQGWELTDIQHLSEPLRYGSSTKLTYLEKGVPFLRIADVNNYRFDPENLKYISEKSAEQESPATVWSGDVLISRSGTLGLAVEITDTLDGAIYGSYFIRTRPDGNKIHPAFLALYVNSLAGQLQVEQFNTGGIQTNLTISAIESIQVGLPPMPIQKMYVEKVLESRQAQDEAKQLLETAKQRVEQMILGEEV